MASYVKDDYKKKYEVEPDIIIEDAIPANDFPPPPNGPPVAAGHMRFYCEKCRTVSVAAYLHTPTDSFLRPLTSLSALRPLFKALRFAARSDLMEMRSVHDLQLHDSRRMSRLHRYVMGE